MSVRDAVPGDIYVDPDGKLWRVISTCKEPTVTLEAVEPKGFIPEPPNMLQPFPMVDHSAGRYLRDRKGGAVSAPIFEGLRRIWRREEASQ